MAFLSKIELAVNQRFNQAFEALKAEKKFSKEGDFAESIGLQQPNFSKYKKNERIVPLESLVNLTNLYSISSDWLFRGEGEMYKQPHQKPVPPAHNGNGNGNMPLVVAVDNSGRENIVMVDTKAAAGYIKHHLEPEYIKDLPALSLPGPEFRNATFRSFQVQGDSMTPGLQNGDFVIASYVHNWPTNIQEGYVYVVVTRQDVLVKRVLNRIPQRGKVVIQSDNEAWPTDEIDADDIIELWRAKAKISFKFPNLRYDTHKKIASLEADVFELKQLVMKQINNKDSHL